MRNGGKKKHEQERWCITKILSFNLTFSGCPQCSGKQVMAHAATVRGRGRRGPTPQIDKGSSTLETRNSQKLVENLIAEAVEAYREGTDVGI